MKDLQIIQFQQQLSVHMDHLYSHQGSQLDSNGYDQSQGTVQETSKQNSVQSGKATEMFLTMLCTRNSQSEFGGT